ncbi:hypothetical protein [Liquorilactobacillus uvarum]|uniref:Integral membrane protein n=1 Tax=Liquorilactobacillus uvarum DSM 19971 TaxID=1423812 RepID=A0A0R1QEC2_9LACO|nr:hypothetical protein [Liquorilactobacillus uvarum]KRL39160.1 hypothetical protein FD20_GL000210 [Liquorilactobacillus uvarum DSM 19971]
MKTTKLVAGILMIVLSVFIGFQSMAVGLGDALENNNNTSGSGGIIVAILFLVAGIVYLATKSKKKLGGDIANLILLLIAWIIGLSNIGVYSDLVIWSWLAFIIGVGFFIWHLVKNKKLKNKTL